MAARLEGYQLLEELPGGAFHVRSEADLELRLTPRAQALPTPVLLAAHPHVPAVLAVTDERVISQWVPGLSLRELRARAGRRGLPTLPPFLSVSLLQQVCRGLQYAHAHQATVPGEVGLDSVVLGFDGKVRVTAFGSPVRDVAAAALLLDQLIDETLDAELISLIAEAREPEATRRIPTALSLEQRLGHWQVKQRQVFPRHDLLPELMAWLCPTETKREPDPEVAAWLESECTGPVTAEPPVRARPSAFLPRRRWPLVGLGVLTALAALLVLAVNTLFLKREPPPPMPTAVAALPAPPPVPAPPPPAVIPEVIPAPAPPTLPRWGRGAPATVQLSSAVHGIELETSGFSVRAPAPRWAAQTVRMRPQAKVPRYATLFVAEFDAHHQFTRLGQVGERWTELTQPEARFFVMQTDQPADNGSFGLALGTPAAEGIDEQLPLRRPDVLTDSMTDLEYRRFVLEGLNPNLRYAVWLRGNRAKPTPLVIATATIPRAAARSWSDAGFQQKGAPLDQVLLQPATPVMVKDASRLSFVVLTTKGAPESRAWVVVEPSIGAGSPPSTQALWLDRDEVIEALIFDGKAMLKRREFASAAVLFERCVEMDPSDFECQQLRATALAAKRPRAPAPGKLR